MSNHESLPIIRTSERRDFKRCPQRWWWAWREGLRPVETKQALWFGIGMHLVLEHHYGAGGLKRGRNPLKVWREYTKDQAIFSMPSGRVVDEGARPEYVNAVKLGEDMLDGYFDLYGKDEHMFVLGAEIPFQVIIDGPNGEPVCVYAGTWDLLWRDERDSGLWVTDHKTAADLSTKHLTLDDQAGSYWALAGPYLRGQGLIGAKERLKGIEYNILRKYSPPEDDRPVNEDGMRLNKDGSVSKRQPKPLSYRYHRERVHRTAREQATQVQRIGIEASAMDLFRADKSMLYKNPTRDCSWDCAFFNMCELHERQSDWQEFRDMAFVVQDPYADHRYALEGE